MELTAGQKQALELARRVAAHDGPAPAIGVINGVAGSGKTTVLNNIRDALGGMPIVVCPTGKAALRVREAAGLPAKTIHLWLYTVTEDENTGEPVFTRKTRAEMDTGEIGLLIVDESSMVGRELWDDLYDAATVLKMNILVVGDGFQLPPVLEKDGFCALYPEQPHESVHLTEVVRQALESPIIRATMLVRQGKTPEACLMLPRVRGKDLIRTATEIVSRGGVVICHRNQTRHRLNELIRKELGLSADLQPGEPLLVRQNNYRLAIYNGETLRFQSWLEAPAGKHKVYDRWRKIGFESRFGRALVDQHDVALCEEELFGRSGDISVKAIEKQSRLIFGGGIMPEDIADLTKEELNQKLGPPLMHVNFGYASTAHASQGSEWDEVLVIMEPSVRAGTEEGTRWFYTAATRAKVNLQICLTMPALT